MKCQKPQDLNYTRDGAKSVEISLKQRSTADIEESAVNALNTLKDEIGG